MKRIFIILLAVLSFAGCRNQAPLLPSVSGKAGEVITVIEREDWEGPLGEAVRETLASEYPYLPVTEPMYNVTNVPHTAFGDLFKVHRNVLYFDINPQTVESGVKLRKDAWAQTQCLVLVSAKTSEEALRIFNDNREFVLSAIEQAERDRIIRNSVLYESREVFDRVSEVFGGSPHFHNGYRLRKISDNFAWIEDAKQYSTQGVFVYSYPAGAGDDMTLQGIIRNRNEVLKDNVPGMFEGTYMTTDMNVPPQLRYVRYQGRSFSEVHGWWGVEGDFMGGPFVSHSFYSEDGSKVIVAEGWLYYPKSNKRLLFRQTEAVLYSWENKTEK